MRGPSRWTLRIVRFFTLALFLGLCAACAKPIPVADQFDVQQANWMGEWRSGRFPKISGTMFLRIPDPLPQREEFMVTGAVLFDTDAGGFLPERFELRYLAYFDPDQGFSVLDSKGKELIDREVHFRMTGCPEGTDLKIAYAADLDEAGAKLTGKYTADRPYDIGKFSLSRIPREPRELAQNTPVFYE